MNKTLKKITKNKKGFTLVEVIVVLVILAIMAAVLIPSLVGYIDKAKENSIVTETRSITQAVQTLASEAYANHSAASITVGDTASESDSAVVISYDEIEELAEVEVGSSTLTVVTITKGKVSALTYTDGSYTCTYPGYSVTE